MGKVRDYVSGQVEALGSTLVHKVPAARWAASRWVLKLTDPNDRLLRWRVAHDFTGPSSYWATLAGPEDIGVLDLDKGTNGIFAVNRDEFETHLDGGRVAAVAYGLGEITMVGVAELRPDELLLPVNESGTPHRDGNMLGVVMRAGENPLRMAIGTSGQLRHGRDFWPVETALLRTVMTPPNGLYRV